MDFKPVWENKTSGDKVFLDTPRALVRVEMAPVCSSHEQDAYCRYCLPRLTEAWEVVRRILDPEASPKVSEHHQKPSGPEYLALYNPIGKAAFKMRFHSSTKVLSEKSLFTGEGVREDFDSITLAKYTTKCRVSEVNYMPSFFVRIKDGASEGYLEKLWDASLTICLDGEPMVQQMKLKQAISHKEIVISRSDSGCLFYAIAVKEEGADPNEWLGYMLPNGTVIEVTLAKVPSGGGLVLIETGWILGTYTTRETGGSPISVMKVAE